MMRKDNERLNAELQAVTKEIMAKSEKINWFERKLNKWIKLFEEAEQESANRHNGLVSKINEVDAPGIMQPRHMRRARTFVNGAVSGRQGKFALKHNVGEMLIKRNVRIVSQVARQSRI